MEHNIKSLINYNLMATDGMIGELEDIYFEDNSWKIHYFIVKTGSWLAERKVLIPLDSVIKEPWKNGSFSVRLIKEQIKNSPDISKDKPVSRQQDLEIYGHYAWQRYGGGGFYAGGSAAVMDNDPIIDEKILTEANHNDKRSDDDIHLRSTEEITGYHIHATNGDIGHVNDLIIDDQTWQIIFLVIDTHNWFGGKKVLISVQQVKEINWSESKLFLNIPADTIEKSILFDENNYLYL